MFHLAIVLALVAAAPTSSQLQPGYEAGYEAGYAAGYAAGYTAGYAAGYAAAPASTDQCGDEISSDCQWEYDNAMENGNMGSFYRRCATEGGARPLRSRCSLCCEEPPEMRGSEVKRLLLYTFRVIFIYILKFQPQLQPGYEAGYAAGYAAGYTAGYTAGYAAAPEMRAIDEVKRLFS